MATTTIQTVAGKEFTLEVGHYGEQEYRAYLRPTVQAKGVSAAVYSHRGTSAEDAIAKVSASAALCIARDEYHKVSGRYIRLDSTC